MPNGLCSRKETDRPPEPSRPACLPTATRWLLQSAFLLLQPQPTQPPAFPAANPNSPQPPIPPAASAGRRAGARPQLPDAKHVPDAAHDGGTADHSEFHDWTDELKTASWLYFDFPAGPSGPGIVRSPLRSHHSTVASPFGRAPGLSLPVFQ